MAGADPHVNRLTGSHNQGEPGKRTLSVVHGRDLYGSKVKGSGKPCMRLFSDQPIAGHLATSTALRCGLVVAHYFVLSLPLILSLCIYFFLSGFHSIFHSSVIFANRVRQSRSCQRLPTSTSFSGRSTLSPRHLLSKMAAKGEIDLTLFFMDQCRSSCGQLRPMMRCQSRQPSKWMGEHFHD